MESKYDRYFLLGVIGIIIFIGLSIWIINKINENNLYSQQRPFWKGTEQMQVCKAPYFESKDCRKLNVRLIDNKTVEILSNGDTVTAYKLECWITSSEFQKRYTFCSSWDEDDQQYDLVPLSARF